VTLLGPNGAGKTTLLLTVAGIVRAHAGRIHLAQREVHTLPAERIVALGCSLVPEGRQVFGTLTVRENLLLGAYLRLRGRRPDSRREAARWACRRSPPGGMPECRRSQGWREAAGDMEWIYGLFPILKAREGQLAGTLSGGEQQMLALGRALMARPTLLLLDEPSLGLAPLLVRDILEKVASLRADGMSVLLVEQNVRSALQIADRGYVLETGSIVLEGNARELLENRDVQRAYLGKEYRRIEG
jgi:branched-chain amino acid transport system ATP-binding protein